jgi:hypothetical protein
MTDGRAELQKAAEALMEAIAQEGRARQRKAEALLKALAADDPPQQDGELPKRDNDKADV